MDTNWYQTKLDKKILVQNFGAKFSKLVRARGVKVLEMVIIELKKRSRDGTKVTEFQGYTKVTSLFLCCNFATL